MKISALSKQISMSLLVLGLAVSCGSSPEKDSDSEGSVEQGSAEQSAAAAAISNAKSSLGDAKSAGTEWKPTGGLIKKAQAAYDAGDYDKATKLANEADMQAQNAITQAQTATQEFEPTTEANEPSASDSNVAAMNMSDGGSDKVMMGGSITSYFVYEGDNLWNIAGLANVYDNPYQWPLIYKANAAKINDPDMIFPGQVFDINQNVLSEEVEAAISHARNRGAWTIDGSESSDADYLAK